MPEGDFTQPAQGNYPSIAKGFGVLTPTMWGRMMGMLEWFEGAGLGQVTSDEVVMVSDLRREINRLKTGIPYIFAKITGSATLADNRWKYAWTQVRFDADSPYGIVAYPDAMSGTTSTNFALNMCEVSNVAASAGPGVRTTGSGYPASFSLMPIGGLFDDGASAGTIDVVVPMFLLPDDEGNLTRWFSLANSNDGGCS
jgi:hypothetical protein